MLFKRLIKKYRIYDRSVRMNLTRQNCKLERLATKFIINPYACVDFMELHLQMQESSNAKPQYIQCNLSQSNATHRKDLLSKFYISRDIGRNKRDAVIKRSCIYLCKPINELLFNNEV